MLSEKNGQVNMYGNLTRDYHVITMVTIQVSSTQVGGLGLRLLYFHIGLTRTITNWVLKHLSLTLHNYKVKQQVCTGKL